MAFLPAASRSVQPGSFYQSPTGVRAEADEEIVAETRVRKKSFQTTDLHVLAAGVADDSTCPTYLPAFADPTLQA